MLSEKSRKYIYRKTLQCRNIQVLYTHTHEIIQTPVFKMANWTMDYFFFFLLPAMFWIAYN